jgi:hypothetical protein
MLVTNLLSLFLNRFGVCKIYNLYKKHRFKYKIVSSRMIKIKIDQIVFRPKFPCSLSIIAKICNYKTNFRESVVCNSELNAL